MKERTRRPPIESDLEICILAGGLSTRMGRDKARLRLGRRTLLGHVRANAAQVGLPVQVLRKDLIARCGPLGGIYSALRTTRHQAALFLACDMPFVSPTVLRSLLEQFNGKRPVFAFANDMPGFPLILPKVLLPKIEQLISKRKFSLHNLALATRARLVRVSPEAVFNINTAAEFALARDCVRRV
jgi:molybdopterin-guanine dinucleotide biosynthesis protein A